MEWSRERFGAIYRDSLGAISEIRSEPSKDSVRYTKRVTKTWQKNGVAISIKGSRQIKQRQERDFAFIESREKVIDDLEKGCLGERERQAFLVAFRSDALKFSVIYLVSRCFELSQPQRITSGQKTDFSLSPSYLIHKSSNHKSFLLKPQLFVKIFRKETSTTNNISQNTPISLGEWKLYPPFRNANT